MPEHVKLELAMLNPISSTLAILILVGIYYCLAVLIPLFSADLLTGTEIFLSIAAACYFVYRKASHIVGTRQEDSYIEMPTSRSFVMLEEHKWAAILSISEGKVTSAFPFLGQHSALTYEVRDYELDTVVVSTRKSTADRSTAIQCAPVIQERFEMDKRIEQIEEALNALKDSIEIAKASEWHRMEIPAFQQQVKELSKTIDEIRSLQSLQDQFVREVLIGERLAKNGIAVSLIESNQLHFETQERYMFLKEKTTALIDLTQRTL